MSAINPYIIFNGNCEEAFNFYKSVLGGEFGYVGRFKDAPGDGSSAEGGNRLMHISLPLGRGTVLMGSDSPEGGHMDAKFGNNFSLSLSVDSEAEADRVFNGLSAGGAVHMPLAKQFWGSYFGMLGDKFGINWMVSYDGGQQQQ